MPLVKLRICKVPCYFTLGIVECDLHCYLVAALSQVGEVVYCRVSRAHRAIEAELSCVEGSGKAGGLGPLPSSPHSNLFHCSLGLCRK